MKYVLDASAMIALLRDEPGAQKVKDVATDRRNSIHAHAMNLVEVFTTSIALRVLERPRMPSMIW